MLRFRDGTCTSKQLEHGRNFVDEEGPHGRDARLGKQIMQTDGRRGSMIWNEGNHYQICTGTILKLRPDTGVCGENNKN